MILLDCRNTCVDIFLMMKIRNILIISTMFCAFTSVQALGLAAWGGFNIPSSGTVTGSTFGLSDSSNLTITKGGFSAGAAVYPIGFGPIQLGVGAALLPFQSFTLTSGSISGVSGASTIESNFLPMYVELRIGIPGILPIVGGLYVSGGGGYAFGMGSATIGDTAVAGFSAPGGTLFTGSIGSDIFSLGPLGIDFSVMLTYIQLGDSSALPAPYNSIKLAGEASSFNITPRLGVNFIF